MRLAFFANDVEHVLHTEGHFGGKLALGEETRFANFDRVLGARVGRRDAALGDDRDGVKARIARRLGVDADEPRLADGRRVRLLFELAHETRLETLAPLERPAGQRPGAGVGASHEQVSPRFVARDDCDADDRSPEHVPQDLFDDDERPLRNLRHGTCVTNFVRALVVFLILAGCSASDETFRATSSEGASDDRGAATALAKTCVEKNGYKTVWGSAPVWSRATATHLNDRVWVVDVPESGVDAAGHAIVLGLPEGIGVEVDLDAKTSRMMNLE